MALRWIAIHANAMKTDPDWSILDQVNLIIVTEACITGSF